MASATAALDASTLDHFSGEPTWLADARRQAWTTYADGGMPDRAQHLWRYTDPAKLLPEGYGLGAPLSPTNLEEARGALPEGVILSDLTTALQDHRELVERALGKLARDEDSRWTALNSALWQGGAFLYVPRNTVVEQPIQLSTRIPVAPDGAEQAFFPRLVVIVERGAEVSLVDEHTSEDEGARAYVDGVTELLLEDGARLRYAQVQAYGSRVVHSLTQRAQLGRDASLGTITIAVGSRISKADVGTDLVGKGANTEMLGVVFGDDRQHFDHHTVLDHKAEHTTSNLDFKVALANRASSAYTGLLRVREEGLKADASQLARNLLLSDGARADAIPELEIMTDDVSAAHGVAAGPIDAMQLFFCQARGLSRREAVNTIVGGFFEPIIAKVPSEEVRERLRSHVATKLEAVDVDALPMADSSKPARQALGSADSKGTGGKLNVGAK